MHFSLVKIAPPGFLSAHGFDDVILPLYHAFARLGFRVEMRVNSANPNSVNILFGTCQAPALADAAFPSNSIVFNLEQLASSAWAGEAYVGHLKRFTVWDYSPRNIARLERDFGLPGVTLMRLGYVPEMTRLRRDFPQDVDLLFYGYANERRKNALDAMVKGGVRLGALSGEYGAARDQAIARAKIVLNVHYYTPASLEIVRLGYLWANRKAVVSELRDDTELYPGLESACLFSSYDKLRPAVHSLLRDDAARERQGEAGFAAFSAMRQEDFLKEVLGPRLHAAAPAARRRPVHLHAGSGKDFRLGCLNVDIAPAMNPDLVLDLSLPLDFEAPHNTTRFGTIRLTRGGFIRITAFELLEHVADLPRLMRNFLDLLAEGGELELSVPYELSLGAWQDPTHVRAFNENSWLYYTSWAWYLGWRDHRFDLVSLDYILSGHGRDLAAAGKALEELRRIPRAVDGMRVTLRKRAATREEKDNADALARSFYDGAVGEWAVAEQVGTLFGKG